MADFPALREYDLLSGGVISVGQSLAGLHMLAGAATAWPSANMAIGVPVFIPRIVTIYKIVVGEGATGTGDYDVGLYDMFGNKILAAGVTTKAASASEKVLDITDTVVHPGFYYGVMAAVVATDTFVMFTPSGGTPIGVQKTRLSGVVNVASGYSGGLVTPLTWAAATFEKIPAINFLTRPY